MELSYSSANDRLQVAAARYAVIHARLCSIKTTLAKEMADASGFEKVA